MRERGLEGVIQLEERGRGWGYSYQNALCLCLKLSKEQK